jgi:hypothetical protein
MFDLVVPGDDLARGGAKAGDRAAAARERLRMLQIVPDQPGPAGSWPAPPGSEPRDRSRGERPHLHADTRRYMSAAQCRTLAPTGTGLEKDCVDGFFRVAGCRGGAARHLSPSPGPSASERGINRVLRLGARGPSVLDGAQARLTRAVPPV